MTHNRGQYVICCVCICSGETLGMSTVVNEKLASRGTGKENRSGSLKNPRMRKKQVQELLEHGEFQLMRTHNEQENVGVI